jgi:hypothetical protein
VAVLAALSLYMAALTAAHGRGCASKRCKARVELKRLTPYVCSFGRSAIPCYIVMCESRGRWTALNRSGAAGLYQLMPMHGRPFPVRTSADRLAHHRIAHRLWRGGAGAGNWVCA